MAEKEYQDLQYKVSELELMIEATMGKAMNIDANGNTISKFAKKVGKKASIKRPSYSHRSNN